MKLEPDAAVSLSEERISLPIPSIVLDFVPIHGDPHVQITVWICLLLAFGFIKGTVAQDVVKPQVDHVAIYVSDLERSVAFYKDTFGFERVPMPVTFAAWLSMGKGVMLHIVAGRKEAVVNSKWDHLSIACSDITVMTVSLDAKHIPWASMEGKPEPTVRFDGVKQIFVKDPDGYWIEINDALKVRLPAK